MQDSFTQSYSYLSILGGLYPIQHQVLNVLNLVIGDLVRGDGPNGPNLVRGGGQVIGDLIPSLSQVPGGPIPSQGQPQNGLLRDEWQHYVGFNLVRVRGQVLIGSFAHFGANQVPIGLILSHGLMPNQGFD